MGIGLSEKKTKDGHDFPFGGMLPYGRQSIDQDDIDAVVDVLKSPWLTTGPKVAEFERAIVSTLGCSHAVAVSSGTAALHCAMAAIGIAPGDEVIVPSITFLATANSVVYQEGKAVFADVLPDTLLIDPRSVESLITPRTRAIIAVDYAGQACDYDALRAIADKHKLSLVADACHSLGASFAGRPVGTLADITVFSFHPVKMIAAGEGGMLVTDNSTYADYARSFRNHGMSIDQQQRAEKGVWQYAMHFPGFNYRLSDIHAALAISQLRKLNSFLEKRQKIAAQYDESFIALDGVKPLFVPAPAEHAYHLYVVLVEAELDRDALFQELRKKGIGVNVHYYPVHLQPYYRANGAKEGDCPGAESVAQKMLSIPIFPGMTDVDVSTVVEAVKSYVLSVRT